MRPTPVDALSEEGTKYHLCTHSPEFGTAGVAGT